MVSSNCTCSSTRKIEEGCATRERDTETGLDYAFARYYNSREARFMSADPLGGDLTDPQTLNKYTYVRNNSVNFVDPSGLCGGSGEYPNLPCPQGETR